MSRKTSKLRTWSSHPLSRMAQWRMVRLSPPLLRRPRCVPFISHDQMDNKWCIYVLPQVENAAVEETAVSETVEESVPEVGDVAAGTYAYMCCVAAASGTDA